MFRLLMTVSALTIVIPLPTEVQDLLVLMLQAGASQR
jgi:hypothetical protein